MSISHLFQLLKEEGEWINSVKGPQILIRAWEGTKSVSSQTWGRGFSQNDRESGWLSSSELLLHFGF